MPGAVTETLTAVNCSPANLEAHQALVDLYKNNGDNPKEIEEYKRFLRLVPDAHGDRLELAELLLKSHELEEAETACRELLRRIPNDRGQDYQDQQKNEWIGWAHN